MTEKFVEKPPVSIIITTLNNEHTIDECLRSIFELNYPKGLLEVIVVDGGSKDSTTKIVEKYPVKLFIYPSNAPAAYNYALKIAKNDIVAIIDADAKVEKEWLNKLVKHLKNPTIAGAGGGIETWNRNNLLSKCIGYDIKYRYGRLKSRVNRLATMNLLLKKKVIEEIGGFNENLPTQYDTDLCNRMAKKGYRLIYEPNAKCYHFNRPIWKDYLKQQLQYGRNTFKLYVRNPNLIKGDKITDFWMNIQPPLLVLLCLFAIMGLYEKARFMLYFSVCICIFLLSYYVVTAIKISKRFKDGSALLLVLTYTVRAVAWTVGGVISAIEMLIRKGES